MLFFDFAAAFRTFFGRQVPEKFRDFSEHRASPIPLIVNIVL